MHRGTPHTSRTGSLTPRAAQVREVGDGNINFVYIVEGPRGGLVLKQGLPYIRIAPDWPLTQARNPPAGLSVSFKSLPSAGQTSSTCPTGCGHKRDPPCQTPCRV